MKTMTATNVLKEVQSTAEKIRNDATQHFPEAASVGDCVRQGDIYITLIQSVPDDAKPIKCAGQLAPGNTKGSRHCLDSSAGVKMYELAHARPLDGPVLELSQVRTVTHPEHGDWVLPCGVYQIEYQRDLADEERRVAD